MIQPLAFSSSYSPSGSNFLKHPSAPIRMGSGLNTSSKDTPSSKPKKGLLRPFLFALTLLMTGCQMFLPSGVNNSADPVLPQSEIKFTPTAQNIIKSTTSFEENLQFLQRLRRENSATPPDNFTLRPEAMMASIPSPKSNWHLLQDLRKAKLTEKNPPFIELSDMLPSVTRFPWSPQRIQQLATQGKIEIDRARESVALQHQEYLLLIYLILALQGHVQTAENVISMGEQWAKQLNSDDPAVRETLIDSIKSYAESGHLSNRYIGLLFSFSASPYPEVRQLVHELIPPPNDKASEALD